MAGDGRRPREQQPSTSRDNPDDNYNNNSSSIINNHDDSSDDPLPSQPSGSSRNRRHPPSSSTDRPSNSTASPHAPAVPPPITTSSSGSRRPAHPPPARRSNTDPMSRSSRFSDGNQQQVRFSPGGSSRSNHDEHRSSHDGPGHSNPELYTIRSRGDLEEGSSSSHPSAYNARRPSRHSVASDPTKSAGGVSNTTVESYPKDSAPSYKPKKSVRMRWLEAKDAVTGHIGTAYQKVVVETILRQKPLPPSVDGRHVPLSAKRKRADFLTDERSGKPYISNFIRSSRYTVWDFLPKQLLFQFSKLGNAYFLSISIMQMIPGLSTTGQWTTLAPLMAFVALSMAKEGYDDYRRFLLDKADNRSEVQVLGEDLKAAHRLKEKAKRAKKKHKKDGSAAHTALEANESDARHTEPPTPGIGGGEEWTFVQWQDVKVGDIVRLRRDENVPADIVVLYATNPNHVTYIETMALDGETNLKAKRALPMLAEQCDSIAGLKACEATIVSEDPNVDLYRYDGRVTLKEETLPLSLTNVVYRGSTVRNTAETIGLVINTGEECKIRMNAHKHVRAKAPAMQYVANRCILWLVFVLLTLSGGLTAGYFMWRDPNEQESWFLGGATLGFREVFIAYIIMFNTLIPLSLYISLEIIKVVQFYLMGDVEMYDPVTNTPMVANTTTILEDLGQVNYVFSDKTGTLTENVMRFRKMSVAGTAWLHDMDVERDEEAKQKLIEMARKKKKGKGKEKEKQTVEGQEKGKNQNFIAALASAAFAAQPSSPASCSDPGYGVRKEHQRTSPDTSHGGQPKTEPSDPQFKTEDLLEYLRRRPNTAFSRKAKHFLLTIALCHTCLPEVNTSTGEIEYQAASPDEHALVEAARDLGYVLIDRPNQQIVLQLPGTGSEDGSSTPHRETYQVLDVIDFTSKRKRMSIIVRMPDGRICVFCKGADSIILPRLRQSHLALQKVGAVERRASQKRSLEQEKQRMSLGSPRSSMVLGRSSLSKKRHSQLGRDGFRMSVEGPARWNMGDEHGDDDDDEDLQFHTPLESPLYARNSLHSPRHSTALSGREDFLDGLVDESTAMQDNAIFEKCFQHINDFATEGLRTLLFGYRYLEEEEYAKWRRIYANATTSLENRQEKIEEAGELIEDGFDLAGATAIEDKLQEGVPETIEKLRRAEVKVWMLTGDKRETAINIAHSARLCQPFSEVFILDSTLGNLQTKITSTLAEVNRGMLPHTVVVVDGQTLGVIDDDDGLSFLFYDLVGRVDSVICCRAAPAQKANLVKRIRRHVRSSLTLAIGDGANDIGMIQASHVGVGISGREGLQAARISDYSIAQFRFLQRLLFVHGRWNYLRTAKYILATFWKEIVFFLPQAHYQRFNGYSGTSLYENWSLTVFNTLFTSLPVIFLGSFEKDLSAKTLLKYPELYAYGHRNGAINVRLYVGWTLIGIAESFVIYYIMWGVYDRLPFDQDTSLYAMGTVPFNVCVIFINVKLMAIEMHHKTIISFLGAFLSITGWFLWNIGLSGLFLPFMRIYQIRRAFLDNFGATLNFWTVSLVGLGAVIVLELLVNALRRVYFANDVDLMQRMEKEEEKKRKKASKERKKKKNGERGVVDAEGQMQEEEEDIDMVGGKDLDVPGNGNRTGNGTMQHRNHNLNHLQDNASVRTSQQHLRRSQDVSNHGGTPPVAEEASYDGQEDDEQGADPFEKGYGKPHKTRGRGPALRIAATKWMRRGPSEDEGSIEMRTPKFNRRGSGPA